jgi:N-dimethylarginine dimethylaminohydrolase
MITCHTEYGPIRSLILKHPREAFRDQERIRVQWKDLNFTGEPYMPSAVKEYEHFQQLVTRNGKSDVTFLPDDQTVTLDSLYCRDASLSTDHGLVLCSMGKAARVGEPYAVKRASQSASVKILGELKSPGTVEGGDCAWVDTTTLAVGLTYRTNAEGISQLRSLLAPYGISIIEVHLPHYRGPSDVFHLMSVFSPVDKTMAVVYSPLMPVAFRNELLRRSFTLIEVPDGEFDSMGCNVLSIGLRECLVVKGNPVTRRRLENNGCRVVEYEGEEISLKGGGGPTCLTRPMQREI